MTRLFINSLQCELDLQKFSRSQSDANQKEEGKYRFVKYVYMTFPTVSIATESGSKYFIYSLPPCRFLIYVIYSTGPFSQLISS